MHHRPSLFFQTNARTNSQNSLEAIAWMGARRPGGLSRELVFGTRNSRFSDELSDDHADASFLRHHWRFHFAERRVRFGSSCAAVWAGLVVCGASFRRRAASGLAGDAGCILSRCVLAWAR